MKKHFKLILAALCALVLFVTSAPILNAAEEGPSKSGDFYVDESGREWMYYGMFKGISSDGKTITYHLYSDSVLCAYKEGATYRLYVQKGVSYQQITKSVDNNGFVTMGKLSGSFPVEYAYYNFPTGYETYTSSFPVFSNRQDLIDYLETGDSSNCINPDDLELPVQENSLPYLQNVGYKNVHDCYGGLPYVNGHEISWAVNNFPWRDGGKVEIIADCEVKARYSSSNLSPIDHIQNLYMRTDINVALGTSDFEMLGISPVDFVLGKVIIPEDKLERRIQGIINEKFNEKYQVDTFKVLHYYVRLTWKNLEQNKTLQSKWVRISIGTADGDFGKVVTGDLAGIENGLYTFEIDTDSETSYEYNKDFSGNYPFESDEGSFSLPTSIAEAFNQFVDIIGSLIKGIGKVPELVSKVFSFLPNIFFVLIGGSFTVVVILRILGR